MIFGFVLTVGLLLAVTLLHSKSKSANMTTVRQGEIEVAWM